MKYPINTDKAQTALNLVHDFKDFAMRDNIIDTAVGIIIGSALSNIVSSLVKDILMPPLGLLIGGIHLHHYSIVIKDAIHNSQGKIIQKAVTLNIGSFVQTVFDFMIIAGCLYLAISALKQIRNRYALNSKKQEKISNEQALLIQIRDLLAKQTLLAEQRFNQAKDSPLATNKISSEHEIVR